MQQSSSKIGIPGRAEELAAEIRAAKILIVDDMAIMRKMIGGCLEKGGFTNLVYAGDGQEALDAIAAEIPDLLILDLNMPKVSGYEVCRALRAAPETADLPILVQSASEAPAERVEVFNSGATDFVSKPINQPEMLARVCMHLENKFLIKNLSDFHARMRSELAMAREMQHSLLPDTDAMQMIEERTGLSFEANYQASFELGGDLWGCWALEDEKVGIYVLDVSGHGVGAALNTFRLHATMIRFEGLRDEPAAFLQHLNDAIQPTFPLGQFATMFYGVLDCRTGEFRFAGAGAPRPFIIGQDGIVRLLDSSGTPVGILASAKYEEQMTRLKPGESLFCYSDVLLEAPDESGAFLGEDGFVREVEALAANGDRRHLVDRILEKFQERVPGDLPDDLTAIGLHMPEEEGEAARRDRGTTDRVIVLAVEGDAIDGTLGSLDDPRFEFEFIRSPSALEAALAELDDRLVALILERGLLRDAGQSCLSGALTGFFAESGGPVLLVGEASGLPDIAETVDAGRLVEVEEGSDALFGILCAEVEDFKFRRSVREAVEKGGADIGETNVAVYRFRTRAEAKDLATMLASACREPVAVAIGLTELFVNAVEHGCLDIGHREKGLLIEKGRLSDEIKFRRSLANYADRIVTVEFERTEEQISFRITDPGCGFDHQSFTTSDDGHTKKHGRGITMAGGCFDQLTYLGCGNEVLAVHRLKD